MNKEIFESLDRIDDALLNIDVKVKAIHEKLEELIKALHEYDDDLSTFEDEPQQGACSKHDEASWDEERMDIIGQNGNEGIHYVTNEEADEDAFSDYGMRIAKKVMSDKDNVRVGKDKSNTTQPKQKQYWKNNRSKRSENKK
jgi:Ca2+-dependent lipid-binding protein